MGDQFKATASPPNWVLLNPLAWILWLLDFLVWILTLGPIFWVQKMTSKEAQSQVVDAKTPGHRRHPKAFYSLLLAPEPGMRTVYEMVSKSFKKFATRNALGTRTYLGEHEVEGQRFPHKKFGETKWTTYVLLYVVFMFCTPVNQSTLRSIPHCSLSPSSLVS